MIRGQASCSQIMRGEIKMGKRIAQFLKVSLLTYIIYKLAMSALNISPFRVRDFKLTDLVLDFGIWVVAWVISSFFLDRTSKR